MKRTYRDGELRLLKSGKYGQAPEVCLALPHSCQEWIIGGPYEATLLLHDLERLIPILQAERTKPGSSGAYVAKDDLDDCEDGE